MRWPLRIAIAVGLLILYWGVGYVLEDNIIEYVIRIVLFCGINAILAAGLNLINGTTGQFSIGHAGFMAVGAYTAAWTVMQLELALYGGRTDLALYEVAIVFLPALGLGGLMAALAGVVVGVPSLHLRGDYLAIVTLGFGEIIRLIFNNWPALGGALGYSGDRPLGLSVHTNFFWVASVATLVITLIANFTYSSYGRALESIRDDEIAAEAAGIPTTRFKVLAFVISAASAGVAGGLFAHLQSSIQPNDFKFDKSIDMVVMIILGGLGSVSGAVLGAFFVGLTLELTRDLSEYRLIAYALVLILLMLFRPQGLLGTREVRIWGART
ncbi:MAG TPA: branched-chain amino acid ABC transporter permease [Polyangiales bacterium]|nr:branched-chain amino acid ABC transporter permease [Polyangiales bacterium]